MLRNKANPLQQGLGSPQLTRNQSINLQTSTTTMNDQSNFYNQSTHQQAFRNNMQNSGDTESTIAKAGSSYGSISQNSCNSPPYIDSLLSLDSLARIDKDIQILNNDNNYHQASLSISHAYKEQEGLLSVPGLDNQTQDSYSLVKVMMKSVDRFDHLYIFEYSFKVYVSESKYHYKTQHVFLEQYKVIQTQNNLQINFQYANSSLTQQMSVYLAQFVDCNSRVNLNNVNQSCLSLPTLKMALEIIFFEQMANLMTHESSQNNGVVDTFSKQKFKEDEAMTESIIEEIECSTQQTLGAMSQVGSLLSKRKVPHNNYLVDVDLQGSGLGEGQEMDQDSTFDLASMSSSYKRVHF